MNEKLPYYMAYPMPFSFDDERIERMDLEYLKKYVSEDSETDSSVCRRRMRPYGIRKQYGVRRIS